LSGKIGQDWRLGLLNIQTDEDVPNQIASNNNMITKDSGPKFRSINLKITYWLNI